MKPLTVLLPEDVYERAERRAAGRGLPLPLEVAELVRQYGQDEPAIEGSTDSTASAVDERANISRLIAALERIQLTEPIGPLNREELYDRPVLH